MHNLNLFQRAIKLIETNQAREINCIPLDFPRFSQYYPGIEQGTYSIVTGNSGVGKTQVTDYMFLHTPMNFFYKNHEKVRVKIKYYSLEMPPVVKALQCVAHKIYDDQNIRIGIKQMMSIQNKLDSGTLDLIKGYEDYFEWFFQVVDVHSGQIPPYAIYRDLYDFYAANGKIHEKEYKYEYFDREKGQTVSETRTAFDFYEPNDPNLYLIVIIDHAALVAKQRGKDKRESMEVLSEYMITIRNQFGASIVSINQQASDQESKDNYKRPTLSGLGDNKAVQRDVDYVFGIYDPMRHNSKEFKGFSLHGPPDKPSFHKRYRELILLKGRYGPADVSTDLLYDGTTEKFWELPHPSEKSKLEFWYTFAGSLPIIL